MNRYDHSVDLPCSPEVVWAYTTDLARTPEWRTTITSVEPPAALAAGERFSGTTRLLGRTWTWGLRIVAVEPGRRFVYEVVDGVARPTVEYRLEPIPTGCRFTISGWIDEMSLVARAIKPFALRALNRETVRHLENLRRNLAEHTEAPASPTSSSRADRASDGPQGALSGVRVVDLTTILMGPMAARILADHGADVIRIDPPTAATELEGGAPAIALDIHRNKRSVMLDLKSEEGAAAVRDLIASADVLVSNMRSAALNRLGLSAEALRADHPRLIHCVANGYGADGPYADRAAYDDAIQAISGLAALPARITGEPAYVPSVVVDKTCALFVVQAVMAALLHRHNTGEGQTIRVPMFETMVSFLLVEHLRGAALVPPQGELGYQRLLNPNRRPYRAADGWVALLPYNDANWRDFFALIDRGELSEDPRFSTHGARIENVVELYQFVADAAPGHTVAEWMTICEELSIPASPVLDIGDLFDDEHLRAVDLFPIVEHPELGDYRSVRHPVSYDTMSTELRRHAPAAGQHTAEVLSELGWSEDRIASL